MGQIRIECSGAKAQNASCLMHIAYLAALEDQRYGGSLTCMDQMLLYRRHRQQRRDRYMILIHSAIGQDDYVRTL